MSRLTKNKKQKKIMTKKQKKKEKKTNCCNFQLQAFLTCVAVFTLFYGGLIIYYVVQVGFILFFLFVFKNCTELQGEKPS